MDIRRQAREFVEARKPSGEVVTLGTKLPISGLLQLCSEIAQAGFPAYCKNPYKALQKIAGGKDKSARRPAGR